MNRKIDKILESKPTIEGAGVHLKRAFGYYEVPLLDPFLLLDGFRSNESCRSLLMNIEMVLLSNT